LKGKRSICIGDDTWEALYPNYFTKMYPYPSLIVKDIHTVDNGVIEHIFPLLRMVFFKDNN
jgi:phosphatidylinositol glycan class O